MTASDGDCARLREQADALVLGELDGTARAEALRHVASCPACQAYVDDLNLVADRLLLVAPELEPPAGFESRVLERLATTAAPPASQRVGSWPRLVTVAAALVVLAAGLAALSFALGRSSAPARRDVAAADATHEVRSGTIVRTDGTEAGRVALVDQPRPLVLVTVDEPRPSANEVTCELVLADGEARDVGSWSYDDVVSGAWAVGIDPALLSAVRMNVRGPEGAVLATAALA